MRRVQDSLLRSRWRTLIIMDAARADYTYELDRRFQVAEALGGITHVWCAELWKLLPEPMTHVTANPVVSWKREQTGAAHVNVVEAWRELWREFGRHRVGSVHPTDLTVFTLRWVEEHGMPRRLVVHYLQPHAPYIAYDLPVRCGNLADGPTGKHRDRDVVDSIREGLMTWEQLRAAYRANLMLVLQEAWALAGSLVQHGEVVITSDHGEALGEGGYYGHAGVPYDMIRRVPYWSSAWRR